GDQQKINEYDIDGAHFNAEKYVKKLINEKRLVELIRLNKSMNEGNCILMKLIFLLDIKNLDNSLQRLVYANYNKFITATETIKTVCFCRVFVDDFVDETTCGWYGRRDAKFVSINR